ncbi:MAG: tetratricopeptide repeat protein [Myxococcota bacterium]
MWMLLLIATTSTDGALQRAQGLENQGDDVGAAAILETAVAGDPTWAMARLELGRLQLKLGQRLEVAEAHLDIARSLAPENPRAHYLFALAADERGRRKDAVRALQVALALRDDYADARYRLAGLLYAEGDFARAAQAYADFAALHPEATGARLQLASALEQSGQEKQAEKELRKLMEVPASRPVAGRRLAELLERQGRAVEAQKVRHAVDPPKKQLRALKPSRK